MKTRDNLVELIGLAAVVVTLIFVGMEIRQNTIASRAAAYQEHGAHLSNQYLQLALDPSFAELWLTEETDWNKITENQRAQLLFAWIATFRNFETILLQVEEGLLNDDALDRYGWAEFEPGFTAVKLWPQISQSVSPRFRKYLEDRYPKLVAE